MAPTDHHYPPRELIRMPKRTPLYGQHQRVGADLIDFAGWTMPLRYTSEIAEHHAVRSAAGLFDLSHMGEIEVAGEEAAAALDYALVGKPSAMKVGEARYTVICNDSGGIVDDLVIYRLEPSRFLLVANASNTDAVLAALMARTANSDVSVTDATTEWSLVAIQGPASETILAAVTDRGVRELKYYSIAPARLLESDVLVARTGYTGETGFEIYCRPEHVENVWRGLLKVGTPQGLKPAGLACRDTLRLEAGMALYGNELNTQTSPFEAGLERLVDFTKEADFIGRAALEARHENGATHTLVGLVCQTRRCPRRGHSVVDLATGQIVGQVTSGAPSPTLGYPIAIASVKAEFRTPGTQLAVDVRGTHENVEVVRLPFYRRNKQ